MDRRKSSRAGPASFTGPRATCETTDQNYWLGLLEAITVTGTSR
jgi:hypothetical protein